jgi:hypothetical protein
VTRRSPEDLVALAAELDERDAELAGRIALVRELLAQADGVRGAAAEIAAFLDSLPTEREAVARAATEAAAGLEAVSARAAEAEARRAELEGRRRAGAQARADAERELDRARAELADAEARVARLAAQAGELDEAERARRAEADALGAEAHALAGRIRDLPRVSEAGRGEPGPGLEAVADWGSRAHAALFVVRGTLEGERERVVREASELGALVLGEPPVGASVAAVRRRVEQALGAS